MPAQKPVTLTQTHPDLDGVPEGRLEDLIDQPAPAGAVEIVDPAANLPASPAGDAGVLALLSTDDEWADVDDGDLDRGARRIPYLKLNRNLDGGFTIPDTGEITRTIDFVWLLKGKSRAWFATPFGKGDAAPACRSGDGLHADPTSPDLQNGGDCATCPLSSFDDDTRGGQPRCREAVEALVFIPDPLGYGQLARLRWNGIAVQPARRFWDSFSTRIPKRVPMAYVSRAVLEPTSTDFGEKLAPRFERVAELTRAEAQPLIVEREERRRDFLADTAADLAEGVGHDADEAGPFDGASGGAGGGYDPSSEPF